MNRFLRIAGFSIAICVLAQWLLTAVLALLPFAANMFLGSGVEVPRWFITHPRALAAFLFFMLFSPSVITGLIIATIIYFFRRH